MGSSQGFAYVNGFDGGLNEAARHLSQLTPGGLGASTLDGLGAMPSLSSREMKKSRSSISDVMAPRAQARGDAI